VKAYLFSICIRGFIAFSGFLVFIVTARFFGAEGRGTIAFGSSLFASIGILLSFNLGRVFLGNTLKDENRKKEILPTFLFFNFILSLITMIAGIIYWSLSSSAQAMLTFPQIVGFSFLSFFYVWFHNGHPFFSSFSQTKLQDTIIFGARFLLLVFLLSIWLLDVHNITFFIWGYAFILFTASLVELFFLMRMSQISFRKTIRLSEWKSILASSWWPHIDYVIFNIFPLILTVLSAGYLTKTDLGRFNFAIQIVNLIFLLSTTANMRIANYVSSVGFMQRLAQLRNLFWFTTVASIAAVVIVFAVLTEATSRPEFASFAGASSLFLIAAFAIPGYLSYQFLNPIWIEIRQLKSTALLNLGSAVISFALYPLFIKHLDGVVGLMCIFSIFYFLVLCGNLYMYFTFIRNGKK